MADCIGAATWSVVAHTAAGSPPAGLNVLLVAAVAVSLALGLVGGVLLVRWLGGHTLERARAEADRVREAAESAAKATVADAELAAQKKALEERQAFESEIKAARDELRQTERRLAKREDQVDMRLESFDRRDRQLEQRSSKLARRERGLNEREAKLNDLDDKKREELRRVAGLSAREAKAELLELLERDYADEAARSARRIIETAETEARQRAREITINAVQRYAGELVAESTSRVIEIPSDDLKGRIIGREGRNIRAIEKYAGVDLIVDDTPGIIMVSCFDRVRQAVAVEAIEQLVADGRIHPGKIEEVVEQKRAEINERIVRAGDDAALESKIKGLHPKLREAMGKLSFRTSYGQNVLKHSIEVGYLSQLIADQLGLNGRLARRCGFLHDVGKAMDHEHEGGHPKVGMEFAKQYGEKEPVLNVIGGHHGDIASTTFYTPIVMAADALSGARPGARRESLENYIKRLTHLQDIAKHFPGVTEAHAVQAGREVRVMVDARKVTDDQAFDIARRIADQVSDEMTFPGEIKVTVLRELRAVEVAR